MGDPRRRDGGGRAREHRSRAQLDPRRAAEARDVRHHLRPPLQPARQAHRRRHRRVRGGEDGTRDARLHRAAVGIPGLSRPPRLGARRRHRRPLRTHRRRRPRRRARGLDGRPAALAADGAGLGAHRRSRQPHGPARGLSRRARGGSGLHRLPPHRVRALGAELDRGPRPGGGAARRRCGTLKERLRTLDVAPADLAGNAADLASRVADQATGSQAPYSHADLAEFSADLDGIAKSALLVDPLVREADPAASAALAQAIEAARATLDGFKADGAFPSYDQVDAAGRTKIAGAFSAVATAAAAFNPAIGLE